MTSLILALDVLTKEDAISICEKCAGQIDMIKLGYPLILAAGLNLADELKRFGLPLIADFKVADIPNTSRLIAEQVFAHGFSAIICHGFVGSDSVKAVTDVAHSNNGKSFIVSEMSHPGAVEFFQNGTAESIAKMAVKTESDGIIAPATRPDRVKILREIIGNRLIYSPGVGAQGGNADEISEIVDGIIVGRAIYEAKDPFEATKIYQRFR